MTLMGTLRRAHPKIGALAPSSALVRLFAVGLAHAAPAPDKLHETHCLSCHAPNRLDGPAGHDAVVNFSPQWKTPSPDRLGRRGFTAFITDVLG